MSLENLNLEIFLSLVAIIISLISLLISNKKYKLEAKRNNFETKKYNKEELKPYQDSYYNEFLKTKELFLNIPILDNRIGLLFHKYSKDEKEYINHLYLDIENSILETLGDEIYKQNIVYLDSMVSSVRSVRNDGYHIFSHIKNDVIKLENLLDENSCVKIEHEFINIFEEFSLYFKSIQEDLKTTLEQYNNILYKAKKERILFNNNLSQDYDQIKNLMTFMLSLIGEIKVNPYHTIETLTEDILFIGIKLKIVTTLQERVLNG